MEPARRGLALVVLSAVSFGGVAVLGKLLLAAGMGVASMQAWRWAIAFAALAPFALRGGLGMRAAAAAFAIGFVGQGLTSGLYFASLRTLPAAVGSFLLYLNPVLVAVLAASVLGERLTMRGSAALGLAVLGLGMLAFAPGVLVAPEGVALALAAALCYACVIVAMRRLGAARPLQAACCLMAGAALAFTLAALADGSLAPPSSDVAWAWVLVLGIVSTALSVGTFYLGLPLLGAPRTALVSTLEPVSTVAVAYVVLGELFTPLQALGAGVVLAAVALLATETRATEDAA